MGTSLSRQAFLAYAIPFTANKDLSLNAALAVTRGVAPGFDAMRLYLALSVVVFHATTVCYGMEHQTETLHGLLGPPILSLVPIFFSLSGFAIASSMARVNSVKVFLVHRGLRIVPALCVETLLTALLLGPLFTSLPLNQYFSDTQFLTYFWGMVGRIRYGLPGVFDNNPYAGIVNGHLWTIPFELRCYFLTAVFMAFGFASRRWAMLILFAVGMVAVAFLQAQGHFPRHSYDVLGGEVLMLCFLGGFTAFLWRDRLRMSVPVFVFSVTALVAMLASRTLIAFSPILFVYVTVFLGMMPIKKPPFMRRGDYSYGIYLYSFPLQQGIVAFAVWGSNPLWNLAASLPLTIGLAVASWMLVEKPALALKRLFLPSKTGPSVAAEIFASGIRRLRQRSAENSVVPLSE